MHYDLQYGISIHNLIYVIGKQSIIQYLGHVKGREYIFFFKKEPVRDPV